MSFLNLAEPVTFVLSPTLINKPPGSISTGSRPERSIAFAGSAGLRGCLLEMISLIMEMCSGVVPQHPPTIFKKPSLANSSKIEAISDAVWSYSPN